MKMTRNLGMLVLAIWLIEGLSDGSGHDGVLTFRDMSERVANPMYAAALPAYVMLPLEPAPNGLKIASITAPKYDNVIRGGLAWNFCNSASCDLS